MSQENYTTTKNYKHSRDIAIDILKNVEKAIGESDENYFRGYTRGVRFAIELLEDEWNYSKD